MKNDCKLPANTASFDTTSTKHKLQSSSSSHSYTFSGSSSHEHGGSVVANNGDGKRKLPCKGGGEPDTEAGLELLFAASLIQQNDESNKQKLVEQQQQQLAAVPPGAKAISSCSENESAA